MRKFGAKSVRARVIAAVALGTLAAAGIATADTNTGQGVFTTAQSKRGEAIYMANCAQCHQPDLGGRAPVPELAGDTFMSHWLNHSVSDLFTRISTTMPQGRPGSLSKDQYTDVIAFLLDSNGFASGSAELKPDPAVLKSIQIAGQH